MAIISREWMPNCAMKRIVCHWTAGAHKASQVDQAAYHILIEDDGGLVRGTHSIEDNVSTRDGRYAAHTLNLNTGSIGVSVCCMANAREQPFDPGPCPMTLKQWQTMARVVAELCQFYHIPVTPQTVLGHGEVERILAVRQKQKWDPMVLPWSPTMSKAEVGDAFRHLVAQYIENSTGLDEEQPPEVRVVIGKREIPGGIIANEEFYLKAAAVVEGLKWTLYNAAPEVIVLGTDMKDEPVYLSYMLLGDPDEVPEDATEAEIVTLVNHRGYVAARELAAELGAPLRWDEASRTITIGDISPPAVVARDQGSPPQYTIKPGDTLTAIAARLLGSGSRWREILGEDGAPFTDARARRLRPGSVVFLPAVSPAAAPVHTSPLPSVLDVDALVAVVPRDIRSFARDSIPIILAECGECGIVQPAQIAYILATSEHESKAGRFMVELWGPTPAQRRYEGRSDLGNTWPGDGFRFRGRGYVQITGRDNYATWSKRLNLDLVGNPEIVSRNPDIAAKILVQGMRDGSFRPRHNLERYITTDKQDFFNAREIINADKHTVDRGVSANRGERIAKIAHSYLDALNAAQQKPTA
ncbi:MAG: N-acetylmuramoyl-L-alanine amidase [Syntrophobacteraceae bacterium]|jgi:predicted chitinase|nr:N-acetylmuramoyl-L-alanine amidase [Syntrophobacteraceae bacterium]